MGKAVHLDDLIWAWVEASPDLRDHIQVLGAGFSPSEIRAKIHHADLYDPYIWIATIYDDHITFRSDIRVWNKYGDNTLSAADPEFFKKLERALMYYIDL